MKEKQSHQLLRNEVGRGNTTYIPFYHRCESCFHLMGVDLVYNSTYHPVIVGVDGQPDLSPPTPSHSALAAGRERVARDLLLLLTKEKQVAGQLLEGLTEAADNVGRW